MGESLKERVNKQLENIKGAEEFKTYCNELVNDVINKGMIKNPKIVIFKTDDENLAKTCGNAFANVLQILNVIPEVKYNEATREDMLANYVDGCEIKTRKLLCASDKGVLLIKDSDKYFLSDKAFDKKIVATFINEVINKYYTLSLIFMVKENDNNLVDVIVKTLNTTIKIITLK